MTTEYTAEQVRSVEQTVPSPPQGCVREMLRAYANLLERQASSVPVAWMRPSADGFDSAFRDDRTVKSCPEGSWISEGWIPLFTNPPVQASAQPVDVSTEWHAPGLGEVHSDDNTLMIFCTHASDDSEAGEIVDDDLAKWVCAAMNVDVAAIRAAAWSVASNLGEHMEGYHHDSELVAYVNEQLDVLTRAIGGVK